MVHAVVPWAEAQEVPGVGDTAVLPVDDVVDFDEAVGGAARDAAAAVAKFDDAAGAVRDDVLRAPDRDGMPFGS